jgi:hypothetical protein
MRRSWLLVFGAAGVLVSGYIHYYLYFQGGYRGIAPEEFLGITISRSFAVNAIAAVVIAELLVLSLRFTKLALPAALIGAGFAVATLVAYFLSRTTGLLGFEDDQTSTEAVIAVTAEIVALVALGGWLVSWLRARTGAAAPAPSAAAG